MAMAANLKHWRQVRGLTQPELAEMAGIEQSYLSKLENGRSVASDNVRQRLADALGVDAETLLKDPSGNGRRAWARTIAALLVLVAGIVAGYLASGYEVREVNREGQRLHNLWSLAPAGVRIRSVDIDSTTVPHPTTRISGSYDSADAVRRYAERLLDSGLIGTQLVTVQLIGEGELFLIVIRGPHGRPDLAMPEGGVGMSPEPDASDHSPALD